MTTTVGLQVRVATPVDLTQVEALLRASDLPLAGVSEHLQSFLVAETDGAIVGAIGLEVYGDTALLRSAVVAEVLRHSGVGSVLYEAIIEKARSVGVKQLVLLTTTAAAYFARKGFAVVDRGLVGGPITESVEFREACPDSAVCMRRAL